MASYCYTHQNLDGTTGSYLLEDEEYVISLRSNSHDVIAGGVVTQFGPTVPMTAISATRRRTLSPA